MLFTKKDLASLIVPLLIEQFLAVAIGMADTMMVASVGETAVSAVALVDSVNLLFVNIFAALATGGSVIASQYLGRGDERAACAAANQLLYTATFLSGAITALALAFRVSLLRLIFGAVEDAVMADAQIYFLFTSISYVFLAVYNAGAALFRAMGNSKISMLTSLLMNGLNIVGNAIFIFVFHLGAAGAALSTLIARVIGAALITVLICDKRNPVHVERIFHVRLNFRLIGNILRIGVPSGLENGIFQLGKVLLQSLIASLGTAAIAANVVVENMGSIITLPSAAIGLAMITVIGRCVGAEEKEQAKKYTVRLLLLTHTAVLLVTLVMMLFAKPIIRLYGISSEAATIAHRLVLYTSLCYPAFYPTSYALPNSFRAASDVRYPMLISVSCMWLFRIGLSYVFVKGFGFGLYGVRAAMMLDWVVRGAFFLVHYLRGSWLLKYQGAKMDAAVKNP